MLLDVLPYFIFLAIVIWVYSRQTDREPDDRISKPEWTAFLIMTLFAGLRNASVGTDTAGYVRSFGRVFQTTLSEDFQEMLFEEPGFYLVKLFARTLSDNYAVLLITIAGICYALVLFTIRRHSENRVLSLFIYITLGYYTFCFNAARQSLALSIYLLALPCIQNRDFVRYCILVLAAALFHRTVVIAIPLYFLFTMKYSRKSVILTVAAALVISAMLPSMLASASSIEERYIYYAKATATGGYMLTAFYVILALFFIIMRNRINEDNRKEYDIYLQMLICGSVIYLVVSLSGAYVELTRFAAYFQIASIFLFAKIYNAREKLIAPSSMSAIYISCMVYFFIFLSRMAGLVPYKFNTTL